MKKTKNKNGGEKMIGIKESEIDLINKALYAGIAERERVKKITDSEVCKEVDTKIIAGMKKIQDRIAKHNRIPSWKSIFAGKV